MSIAGILGRDTLPYFYFITSVLSSSLAFILQQRRNRCVNRCFYTYVYCLEKEGRIEYIGLENTRLWEYRSSQKTEYLT